MKFSEDGPCSKLVGSSYLLKYDATIQPLRYDNDQTKRNYINELSDVNGHLAQCVHVGAHVRFGVDARDICRSLRHGENMMYSPELLPQKFDRIIFPFPRSSLKKFKPEEEMPLIRGLMESARHELTPTGEIHLILHTNKAGINQFDIWHIRDIVEQAGYIWRGCLPFNWKLLPPYRPKDVTSKNWTPFEPMIHVFTPRNSKWNVKQRLWRDEKEVEMRNWKRMSKVPESPPYSDPSKIDWAALKKKYQKLFSKNKKSKPKAVVDLTK